MVPGPSCDAAMLTKFLRDLRVARKLIWIACVLSGMERDVSWATRAHAVVTSAPEGRHVLAAGLDTHPADARAADQCAACGGGRRLHRVRVHPPLPYVAAYVVNATARVEGVALATSTNSNVIKRRLRFAAVWLFSVLSRRNMPTFTVLAR